MNRERESKFFKTDSQAILLIGKKRIWINIVPLSLRYKRVGLKAEKKKPSMSV